MQTVQSQIINLNIYMRHNNFRLTKPNHLFMSLWAKVIGKMFNLLLSLDAAKLYHGKHGKHGNHAMPCVWAVCLFMGMPRHLAKTFQVENN